MKVLVTGSAGFIGSYVVEALLAQQFTVIGVDNLSKGNRSNISPRAKFYEMDITNNELESVFQKERPDYVIHLAAQSSVLNSIVDPMEDCQSNIVGTLNILRFSQSYEVKKVIFSSSAAVYGNASSLPIKENSQLAPVSFYALSKLSAEKYIQLYENLFGLKSCILRFSNVFGPLQGGGAITSILHKLLDGETPVIFDGTQTRDFIYVRDVANACVESLKTENTGIFNISSATEVTIQQVYEELSEGTGIQKTPNYELLNEGEITRSVLSNEKAITMLNWHPTFSFVTGLRETIAYYVQLKQI